MEDDEVLLATSDDDDAQRPDASGVSFVREFALQQGDETRLALAGPKRVCVTFLVRRAGMNAGAVGDELLQPQAMAVSFPQLSEQQQPQQDPQAQPPQQVAAPGDGSGLLLQPPGGGAAGAAGAPPDGAAGAGGGEGMTWQPGPAAGAAQ